MIGAGAPSLTVLVELLGAPHEVAASAARALKGMAVIEALCDELLSVGVVGALVRACGVLSPAELREQAARALGNIASHPLDAAIEEAGGVSALVTMLDANAGLPLSATAAALGALSNQTDSPDVRRAFVEAEGVARLVPLLTGDAPSMASLLSASGAEPQPQLLPADPADPAANQEAAAAAAVAPAAAGAGAGARWSDLSKGSEDPLSPSKVTDPLERSVHFPPLGGDPLEHSFCTGDCVGSSTGLTGMGSEVHVGSCRRARASFAAPSATPAEQEAAEAEARLMTERYELRRSAGWILVCIATDPDLAHGLGADGGVHALVAYASAEDDLEIQEEGAWAIASLASNEAHAAHIVETGGLQLLLMLLSSSSGAVRLQVVWALSNLASAHEAQLRLLELGAVPRLVEWMSEGASQDEDALMQVLRPYHTYPYTHPHTLAAT